MAKDKGKGKKTKPSLETKDAVNIQDAVNIRKITSNPQIYNPKINI